MRNNQYVLILLLLISSSTSFSQDWSHYSNTSVVKRFEKFELKIRADSLSVRQFIISSSDDANSLTKLNPFNPDYNDGNGISLEAIFISPQGKEYKVYGFYIEDWKYNSSETDYEYFSGN